MKCMEVQAVGIKNHQVIVYNKIKKTWEDQDLSTSKQMVETFLDRVINRTCYLRDQGMKEIQDSRPILRRESWVQGSCRMQGCK